MCIDQLNTFNFIVGAKYKLHHRNNRSLSKSSKVGIMLWYEVFVKLMSLKHILKRKKKEKSGRERKDIQLQLKSRGDHFRFGLVFTWKNKPNQNYYFLKFKTKTEPNQFKPTGFGLVFVVQKLIKPRSKSRFCCSRTCSSLHDQDMIEFYLKYKQNQSHKLQHNEKNKKPTNYQGK